MNDFGNSLDVVKGALIYGRSPYIPLRSASLVRSPRGGKFHLHGVLSGRLAILI